MLSRGANVTAGRRSWPIQHAVTLAWLFACGCGGESVEEASTPGCVSLVAAGGLNTCARRTDGTLWCWGGNSHGQLGNGETSFQSTPTPVQVLALGEAVRSVAVAFRYTCAIDTDRSLWCWGANYYGQLGIGNPSDQPTTGPTRVGSLGSDVVQISAGQGHACARKTDGTLWCWGNSDLGELGDGTLIGKASPGQVQALGHDVSSVSVGDFHVCAIKNDNSLWCWGANSTGELGTSYHQACGNHLCNPAPTRVDSLGTDVAEVAVGSGHTCARKFDGTVWCWGWNYFGAVGDGTTTDRHSPIQVDALGAEVSGIVAGFHSSCARKSDGTVWCWGGNSAGQLGTNTQSPQKCGISACSPLPARVGALHGLAVELAQGIDQTCARMKDGNLWCWGGNEAEGPRSTLVPCD